MPTDRRTLLALSSALLAGMAGCTTDNEPTSNGDPNGNGSSFEYDGDFPELEFVTDPDLEPELLAEQIHENVAFSLDLLEQLRTEEPDENLFFSPYSVSVALAMTRAGARGETAAEMADALRYELENDDLHGAFGALEDEFERRNEDGSEVDDPYGTDDDETDDEDDLGFELSSANAVWVDDEFELEEDYLELLEVYYEAGERLVDFAGSPEEARQEINAWVEEQTNDRIEDLLPESTISESTRLVLTNAVYFLAAWKHDFDPADTAPGPFTSLGGSETEVELMHQREELRYAEVDGHQLVELPYANDDTSMVVVLPAEGEFESFEESLTVDRLATMLGETSRPEVDLALPKFGIESAFSLVDVMQELGMERAFGGGADFSGMADGDSSDLYVGDIVHESFLEVDEEGTEAAAATAVVMDESAAAEQVEITVDRPFLFYVRDRPTETPLFFGRVIDGETLQD
ncbi:serpin family protein [Natronococcus pandeyae]|uniref:Serpin family protein n=1 Tax=Natronococcus pandeyae TaxID=2055836 RepID=A0A8J8TT94_9EURY|nr:serpin family protein [Natronococcus pandeyae]TYL39940.1 serpin family protein [Natronococcus pandeyae]